MKKRQADRESKRESEKVRKGFEGMRTLSICIYLYDCIYLHSTYIQRLTLVFKTEIFFIFTVFKEGIIFNMAFTFI